MKALKFFIALVVSSYLAGSCECGSLPPKYVAVDLFYRNKNGQDLLDTKTPGHYFLDSISVCGIHPNSDNFHLNTGGYHLTYFIDHGLTKCVISLSNSIFDTLSWTFTGSKLTLLKYNNDIIPPPNGLSQFPISGTSIVTIK